MAAELLTSSVQTPEQLRKEEGLQLFNFLTNFVTFDPTEASRLLRQVSAQITRDYESIEGEEREYFEKHGICLDTHKAQEAKRLRLELQKTVREKNAQAILAVAFADEFKRHTPQSFCKFIGLTVIRNGEPTTVIGMATAVSRCIERGFADYAAECLINGKSPLNEHDYAVQRALSLLHTKGLPSPFDALKNC